MGTKMGHWGCKERCTVALAADLQLGALLDALVDQEHDLVELLLGDLRRHPCPQALTLAPLNLRGSKL